MTIEVRGLAAALVVVSPTLATAVAIVGEYVAQTNTASDRGGAWLTFSPRTRPLPAVRLADQLLSGIFDDDRFRSSATAREARDKLCSQEGARIGPTTPGIAAGIGAQSGRVADRLRGAGRSCAVAPWGRPGQFRCDTRGLVSVLVSFMPVHYGPGSRRFPTVTSSSALRDCSRTSLRGA